MVLDFATQLGITDFTPLDCTRSVARASTAGYERWKRTLIETCKQCRRPWLPRLHSNSPPITFLQRNMSPYGKSLLADAKGRRSTELDLNIAETDNLLLLVGPEGGFTTEERDGLLEHGALPICLAKANLRIEVAAVALVALAAG
jgi:16S rRNA (uracil1498-N3)-methyltransferase